MSSSLSKFFQLELATMLPHLLLIAALSVNLTPTLGVAVHRREAEFRYGSAYVAPAADGSRPDWADAIWRAQRESLDYLPFHSIRLTQLQSWSTK